MHKNPMSIFSAILVFVGLAAIWWHLSEMKVHEKDFRERMGNELYKLTGRRKFTSEEEQIVSDGSQKYAKKHVGTWRLWSGVSVILGAGFCGALGLTISSAQPRENRSRRMSTPRKSSVHNNRQRRTRYKRA